MSNSVIMKTQIAFRFVPFHPVSMTPFRQFGDDSDRFEPFFSRVNDELIPIAGRKAVNSSAITLQARESIVHFCSILPV